MGAKAYLARPPVFAHQTREPAQRTRVAVLKGMHELVAWTMALKPIPALDKAEDHCRFMARNNCVEYQDKLTLKADNGMTRHVDTTKPLPAPVVVQMPKPSPKRIYAPTKLDAEAVREIRSSQTPTRILAKKFGVGKTTINDVRSGKSWKGVDDG